MHATFRPNATPRLPVHLPDRASNCPCLLRVTRAASLILRELFVLSVHLRTLWCCTPALHSARGACGRNSTFLLFFFFYCVALLARLLSSSPGRRQRSWWRAAGVAANEWWPGGERGANQSVAGRRDGQADAGRARRLLDQVSTPGAGACRGAAVVRQHRVDAHPH
jgi:hypothetical protein